MRTRFSYVFFSSVLATVSIVGACGDDAAEDDGSGATGASTSTDAGGAGQGGNTMPTTTTANGGSGGSGPPEGTCASPTILNAGDTVMGDTNNGEDNLTAETASLFGACQNGGAKEAVYEFTASEAGYVTFTLSSATDQGIYFRTACDDGMTEIGCVDGQEGGMDEEAGFFVEASETYYVIVDGYEAATEGPFTLTASTVGTEIGNCQDGTDNNMDGSLWDCSDPTCHADTGCIASQTTFCGASATTLTPGTPQAGDTTNGDSSFGTADPVCTALTNGKSELFTYAPTGNAILGFQLASATDHGMFIRTDCDDIASQVACRDAEFAGDDEFFTFPMADGVAHSIFIAAYEGGTDEGAYTLTTTLFPHDEVEPNDTFGMATTAVGGEYAYISTPADEDWFVYTLGTQGDITFATADILAGDCAESRVDTELELFEDDGVTSIAVSDDIDDQGGNLCSSVTQTQLPAGTYRIRVRSSEMFCPDCTMGYRLMITGS